MSLRRSRSRERMRRRAGLASSSTLPSSASDRRSRSASGFGRRKIGEGGGKIGGRLPDAAPIAGEAGRRVEQGNHGGELDALRDGAGHPHRVEGRPHVGNDLPGRWSRERERGPALASLVERVRDRLQILGGQETERSLAAHRRVRVTRQAGPAPGPTRRRRRPRLFGHALTFLRLLECRQRLARSLGAGLAVVPTLPQL